MLDNDAREVEQQQQQQQQQQEQQSEAEAGDIAGKDAATQEEEEARARSPTTSVKRPNSHSPSAGGRPGHLERSRQMEHFHRIREKVKKAIAARHTFMIHGRSRVVREALLARQWCEKLPRRSSPNSPTDPQQQQQQAQQQQQQQLSVDSSPSALIAGIGDLGEPQNERLLVSKMLGSHTPDLLWNASSDWSGWPAQDNKSTIFNRYTRANFTSKIGLCSNVRQMHWYYEAGIANTLFPRCYNISQSDQMQAFIEDFRMTACLSLLKWLVERADGQGGQGGLAELEGLRSSSGLVPLRALDFAIGRCSDFIGSKSHDDLDQELEKVWSHQWEQFIGWYYKLVHNQASFVAGTASGSSSNSQALHKYAMAARHLLRKLKPHWPQIDMDGSLNVWILKPGNKSRGRGIVLMNRLDDIIAKVSPNNKTNDTRFVVQKYIERPLLIYETKFDIRQWFVVTNAQPLTLWMYRQSYLRFCSQKFSLRDFHESIHLSNNAVQCKYKNSPDRDPGLPADNMWDVASFKQFLAQRGDPDAWEQLIYPGMKQGLVGSLLASQEAMDRRKNSFELYGADFMVMEDYSVWLIEINSHPDMSNSTSVTSRLCRKAMEDIIKVVIDYRENPGTADTGDFELVYKQKLSCSQAYLGTGLALHGTRMQTTSSSLAAAAGTLPPFSAKRKPPSAIASSGGPSTPALIDLIEDLEIQLDHEFHEYVKLRQTSALARQNLPLVTADKPVPSAPPAAAAAAAPADNVSDAQTNTATRTIDLGIVQSLSSQVPHANSDVLNVSDQLLMLQQSSESRRSPRQQQLQRGKNQAHHYRTNLISKIIDLQKHSSVGSSPGQRSYKGLKQPTRPTTDAQLQPRHSSAALSQLLDSDTSAITSNKSKPQQLNKANRLMTAADSSKLKPPIPSSPTTSSKNQLLSNKSRAKDKKVNHSKRRNRIATSQLLVDVTDMYAIGLAVNK